MKAKLIKERFDFYGLKVDDKIIATNDVEVNKMFNYPHILSLKNCQVIENSYDLGELACDWHKNEYGFIPQLQVIKAYTSGFQKALDINKDKKFTTKDVINLLNKLHHIPQRDLDSFEDRNNNLITDKFIEHFYVPQNKWEVEIVTEKVKDETKTIGAIKGVKGSGNKITTYKEVPKLDSSGCLILKRID